MPAAQIHLAPGITLLDAFRVAQAAHMHLIADDRGAVRVSPIVLPGWRKIPLRVKVTSPAFDQPGGCVCTTEREAA